jgi:hypothetical protein
MRIKIMSKADSHDTTTNVIKFPLSVSRRGPKEIGPHIMTAEEVEENYGLLSLEDQAAITAKMAEIVHTRRSRRSKNGTPEERAAKAALKRAQAAARKNLDPAFTLIAEKLAADIAHCEAIDAQAEAEKHGIGEYEADDWCEAACDAVNVIDWKLANTPPTTLAGVAAVLRFANEIEDSNNEWPNTDTIGREGWHYQLRAAMAAGIEAIIRQTHLGESCRPTPQANEAPVPR